MKNYFGLLMLSVSFNCFASESLIPEGILEKWGFKTISRTKNSQTIKGLKKLAIDSDSTWYARYTLSKECFSDSQKAKENLEYSQSFPSNGKDSFRGQFFAVKNCVFHINPHADIFKYYDKSDIRNKFEEYVKTHT